MKAGFVMLDRDREMCLDKIRNIGFKEEYPVGMGYIIALERIAEAKLIPARHALSTSLFSESSLTKTMEILALV